jgi:hypothetical protein
MDRANRSQLVLGSVFVALGALLAGLGVSQLLFWWSGTLTGLTIEPIVLPLGLVFFLAGLPRLLRARRLRWLERHGVRVSAEVLEVTPTREVIDRRTPVVRLKLRVQPTDAPAFISEIRWAVGFEPMVVGRRIEVRHRPGRPRWVAPL